MKVKDLLDILRPNIEVAVVQGPDKVDFATVGYLRQDCQYINSNVLSLTPLNQEQILIVIC